MTSRARALVVSAALLCCAAAPPTQRTFASPEDAVRALADAVKSGNLDEVVAIFGPDGRDLAESSDPATGRRNREIFVAAFGEAWRLVDAGSGRLTLIVGHEDWPFPVPIAKSGARWRFDTAAGKEEVIARRIGRNELAAIATCRGYVIAQRRYARDGHDGKPAGVYARTFNSDPGRRNGLYWQPVHGEPRSPLGDLVADAAPEHATGGSGREPTPFQGYYFRILTAQGPHAPGGASSYLVNDELTRGFALVAWPAQYDVTGVMTFVVNQDGVVRQKDLGPQTAASVAAMTRYDPDASWQTVR